MSDTDGQPPRKRSLKEIVFELSRPFLFETTALGKLGAGHLTLNSFSRLNRRIEERGADTDDEDLVRDFAFAVAGKPKEEGDSPENPPLIPLSDEEAERLSRDDLIVFAKGFVENVLKTPVDEGDPIHQVAVYVRDERKKTQEQMGKLASQIKEAIDFSASTNVLKGWTDLSRSFDGRIKDFMREVSKTYGNLLDPGPEIGEAIRRIKESQDFQSRLGVKPSVFDVMPKPIDIPSIRDIPRPEPRVPDLPIFNLATPMEEMRDNIAVLKKHGDELLEGMNFLLEHVGKATDHVQGVLENAKQTTESIGTVIRTMEIESARASKNARVALGLTLFVSFLAIVISVFAVVRDWSGGEEAKALTLQQLKALEEQNTLLKKIASQEREVLVVPAQGKGAVEQPSKSSERPK